MPDNNNSGYTPRMVTPPSRPTPPQQGGGNPTPQAAPQGYPQNVPRSTGYPPQPPQQPTPPQGYPQQPGQPTPPPPAPNPYQQFQAAPAQPASYIDYGGGYNQPYVDPYAPQPAPQPPKPPKKPKVPLGKRISTFLRKRWYVVLGVTLLMAVIGVATFVFWPRPETVTPSDYKNVEAIIEGPSELSAGVPAIWTIRVTNKESVALNNVRLNLQFDRTFDFAQSLSGDPENIAGTQYNLGTLSGVLAGGNEKVIRLEGSLVGRTDERALMQGTVSYVPAPYAANPAGREVTLALQDLRTQIRAAQVDLSVSTSEATVQNGNEVTVTVTFENLSDKPIDDLRLNMTYPDRGGFEYLNSELQLSTTSELKTTPDDGNNIWFISSLPRFQRQTLRVTGIVQGASGIKQNFLAQLFAKDAEGTYYVLQDGEQAVTLTSQPIEVSTEIRGKNPNSTFAPGERLTFEVDYQNRSNRTLKNVEVLAQIEDPAELLDYSTLEYAGGNVGNVSNRTIQWIANGTPALETVPPQSTGTLSYTVQVKDEAEFVQTGLSAETYVLTPKAEAKAINQQPIQNTGPTYKAAGELSFTQSIEEVEAQSPNAAARRFRVTWNIFTRQSEVKDIILETRSTLPPSVWQPSSIQPNANAGELTYNDNNGRIEWRPGSVRAYTGIESAPKTISFEMELESRAAGNLYEEIQISGIDAFTGVPYEVRSEAGRVR